MQYWQLLVNLHLYSVNHLMSISGGVNMSKLVQDNADNYQQRTEFRLRNIKSVDDHDIHEERSWLAGQGDTVRDQLGLETYTAGQEEWTDFRSRAAGIILWNCHKATRSVRDGPWNTQVKWAGDLRSARRKRWNRNVCLFLDWFIIMENQVQSTSIVL